MKYETEVNWGYSNTVTIMIDQIRDGSTVLEFGPASGRLTRYLSEKKNCTVYIVEIDPEAGQIAAQYAFDSCIGDIENFEWAQKFQDVVFDYILFADVLEHLRDADTVLKRVYPFLKKEGHILVSLPCICHNSVIIDMLHNKFDYQQTGLLDNTHLKFWTENSADNLFTKNGYYILAKNATYTQVGFNEFHNSYESVSREMAAFLKNRPMGEVYQLLYDVSNVKTGETKDTIRRIADYYYAQWFFLMGTEYEDRYSYREVRDFSQPQSFEIEIPEGCKEVRFDPLNEVCGVVIEKAYGMRKGEIINVDMVPSNDFLPLEKGYLFLDQDAQLHIDLSGVTIDTLVIRLKYFGIGSDELTYIGRYAKKLLKSKEDIIEQKEDYIVEQRNRLEELKERMKEDEEQYKQQIADKDKILNQRSIRLIRSLMRK